MTGGARSIWRGVLSSILFSALAILSLLLFSTRRDLAGTWRRIPPVALAAGGASIALVWLAKAGRMWVIARAMGAEISFARLVQIYLTTCFVSHVTPFNAGGVPMQVLLVHREGMPVGMAAALTAVDLGANFLLFVLAVPLALVLGRAGLTYQIPAWFGWLALALGALVLAGLVWRRLRRRTFLRNLLGRWRQELRLFKEGLAEMARGGAGPYLAIVALTVAYWFFYLSIAPIILLGLGQAVPLGYVLGAQLVFNFLQVLLPTPGGSGGSEMLLLGVFAPVLRPGQAGVFVGLWKLYTFYLTLALGGFFFWRLLRAKRAAPRDLLTGE